MKKLKDLREQLISIEELANLLDVRMKDLVYEIGAGRLKAKVFTIRGKGKRYIISKRNVEDYINNHTVKK